MKRNTGLASASRFAFLERTGVNEREHPMLELEPVQSRQPLRAGKNRVGIERRVEINEVSALVGTFLAIAQPTQIVAKEKPVHGLLSLETFPV